MDLKGKSFLKLLDFTSEEINGLLDLAAELKEKKQSGTPHKYYEGKNIALIFEKTSTRTRCAFEVAAADLGMHPTYLDPTGSQIGKKESIADTARVLGRMYDGIEYRGFGQEIVEELAKYAGVQKTKASISDGITNIINSFTKIDEDLFEELEEMLVMSDIGVETSVKICNELRVRVKKDGITDPSKIKGIMHDIIVEMLGDDTPLKLDTKPSIILVIGVNGVGKTTTIGKLSLLLKSSGKKVVLGAADTFRAAAIDQLGVWAERADVTMVKSVEGSDPASVVFDTIASAKSKGADVIICDTAGRLHNKKNLMDELAKIYRIIKRELPDSSIETLLVLDAATGQNAVNQAREFKNVADITGIVLTKLDGTAKGGIVVAIHNELGIPVKYVGVGEGIDDLQPFNAKEFADGIFDLGE